jgi:hypothetical protein
MGPLLRLVSLLLVLGTWWVMSGRDNDPYDRSAIASASSQQQLR